MKKNIIKYLPLLVILIAGSTSCKKSFLDVNPTSSADDAAIFTTTNNARNVINGAYRYLFNRFNTQNMPGHGGVMLNNDFMGEDLHQASASWYTSGANGTGNWNTHRLDNSAWVEYPFRLYYRVIGNMNSIIANIDNAAGPDTDKATLKGEAYGMRAWSYFNLVQYYAKRYDASVKPNSSPGVSMPLLPTDVSLPRSTVEEVYAQINADIDASIAEFNKSGAIAQNKSHFSLIAAKFLKARVALTMQDYPTTIQYANEVISSGKFSLMTIDQYKSGFNDAPSNPEWIWAALIIPDQGDTFGSYFGQISWNGNTSYIRGIPKRINKELYDRIPSTDVRKTLWEPSPNATNFPLPLTTFARVSYMSRKFKTRANDNTLGDVPYMRLAEVYLMLAEAHARTPGGTANAQQALFDFVSKRDPAYVKSTNTGEALINEIMDNRRTELWGEGFRFFDLKRLNQPLDRTVVSNFVPASVNGTMQIPAGDVKWQWAIPIFEIQANPNTLQNP